MRLTVDRWYFSQDGSRQSGNRMDELKDLMEVSFAESQAEMKKQLQTLTDVPLKQMMSKIEVSFNPRSAHCE